MAFLSQHVLSIKTPLFIGVLFYSVSCMNSKHNTLKEEAIVTLTTSAQGHTLHHNGVFSKDGRWVVFDGRNDETKIGETSLIGMVNVETGEERILYKTSNPSIYGPGVGAASFNPVTDRVVFIHGLCDADELKPYAMTRRTGVAVDPVRPQEPIFLDARDVSVPYTAGSLRGGTHGHCWSADGQMLSYTYNDEMVEPDLRTVGVMLPSNSVVRVGAGEGNNDGHMYAAIIAEVMAHPEPGSDEINKAFDECWIGKNGYVNAYGDRVPYAIAFQGSTLDEEGNVVTEIFVVDIDAGKIADDAKAIGKEGERPQVPTGVKPRRLTKGKGFSDLRYWLRSSSDGKYIYALAKDANQRNQIVQCDVLTGEVTFVTSYRISINSPFNLNPDGTRFAFVADNNLIVYDSVADEYIKLTDNAANGSKIVGTPSFSPADDYIVFSQYVKHANGGEFLQIHARFLVPNAIFLK